MRSLLWLAAAALLGCKAPAPSPPTAEDPSVHVWGELVEAGCVADDPGGPDALADELVDVGDNWLECLFDGGSVASCGGPCDDDAGTSTDTRRAVIRCIVRDATGRLRYARCDGGR